MNGYLVLIPETRNDLPSVCSLEPPDPWTPMGVFLAETAGKAKYDAFREWLRRRGVYSDDWTNLRAYLLARNVGGDCGEVRDDDQLSFRLWWDATPILDRVFGTVAA